MRTQRPSIVHIVSASILPAAAGKHKIMLGNLAHFRTPVKKQIMATQTLGEAQTIRANKLKWHNLAVLPTTAGTVYRLLNRCTAVVNSKLQMTPSCI